MGLREKLLFIPALIHGGIRIWVDPPRRLKLKVDHDYEARRERARREMEENLGEMPLPEAKPSNVRQPPPLKCVHLRYPYRAYGRDCVQECRVAVNLKTRRLDWTYTDDWLFGREHQGSGAIGVALFSLPFLLPIAPLLILARRYYEWQEKRRGMSRYGWTLLRALQGQLDLETETLLAEALKNTWAHEQAMNRKVTLDEAKTILASSDLREFIIDEDAIVDAGYHGYHWFDDQGNCVAEGSSYPQGCRSVRILGSTFEDNEVDALIGCCRSREVKARGKDGRRSPGRK